MVDLFLKLLAGNFKKNPGRVKLGWFAEELVWRAFEDMPADGFMDCHVHLLGMGTGGTGCWTNPGILSWRHPLDHLKVMLYLHASAVDDERFADQQYLQRLFIQSDDFPYPARFMLLGLDGVYTKSGEFSYEDTKFYVPNDYIYTVFESDPDRFIPCVSIHPYRKDAVEALEKWAKWGVRFVKWLPNMMGMNPSDPLCEPFYEKMRQYDMVLLGHAGGESAIEVLKFRHLGNPLYYRKPLEMGVKVIMAHAASLGVGIDVESKLHKPVKNFDLFLRLMEDPAYQDLLFADISAITQINRIGRPLKTLLERQDLHHRLINGSDYPLPAVNAAVSTRALEFLGYLSRRERESLNQLYKRNPLLFDFVLKRTLKHPDAPGLKFSTSVFKDHPLLRLRHIETARS